MLVVLALVQVVAYQYARGAVRVALERGVRAASVVGAGVEECEAAIADSLRGVLGGEVGRSLHTECRSEGAMMTATGAGVVPAWVGPAPDLAFTLEARALMEPSP